MPQSSDKLIFEKPADTWENRLPLGNGRLGVMLKGTPVCESLQLNEESIWSGGPMDRNNPQTIQGIEEVRAFMKAGKIPEAQEKAYRVMSGNPVNMRVYQSAGDFNIDFFSSKNFGVAGPMQNHGDEPFSNYRMTLDMEKSLSIVTYTDRAGVVFIRRTFVSANEDAVFMHISASEPGKINFRGNLERGIWADKVFAQDNIIFLEDKHGIPFCTGVGVWTKGGNTGTEGCAICGEGVDEAVFVISVKTFDKTCVKNSPENLDEYDRMILEENHKWVFECKTQIKNLLAKIEKGGFERIFDTHKKEAAEIYGRFRFSLGNDSDSAFSDSVISTPELLENIRQNESEKAMEKSLLINQYVNFGRYLLISSSRKPGILPATLQGIWNCYMDPPWGSKYTININLQMNYWAACMANLPECEETLFELLERGYNRGLVTARKMYNCSGYVMHHNTDIWGDSAPQDGWVPGTYWTLGSGWLATHIWEHFEYTLDKKMLSRYYYLIFEACKFYNDFLTESDFNAPDGKPYLICNPSASPENTYCTKDGTSGVFSPGCEMDNQILTHLFESCLKAMDILGEKPVERERFEYILAHIKKPSLNSDGSIMEWNEEFEEVEPGHRHISHLYGLFPGHSISLDKTPHLAEGAKKTLTKRLSGGGGHTGWSQAWIINFRAALRQPEEAGNAVEKILSHSTNSNLLDIHPPFQIDGNFGALAGILRMIAQSEMEWVNGEPIVQLYLLPALPQTDAWKNGKISGLRLKGNLRLDMEWKDWKVLSYKVHGSTQVMVRSSGTLS